MYNVEVEGFHTFFVGTLGNAVWVYNVLEGICSVVKPLSKEEASPLSDGVLYRIVKGDKKGRPFGSPTNPRTPTIEEFNPRIGEVRAADLASKITGRKHGLDPVQAGLVSQMSDEDLLRLRIEDPMSGHATNGGFLITGGHHRMNEIINRVLAGTLPPDTPVRILFHD
jgi:hypothetical protein